MKTVILVSCFFTACMCGTARAADTWRGQWIGLPEASRANAWMCFRKQGVLAAQPKEAKARIACDSKYWLWVNGQLAVFEGQLKRGPTPQDTYYDEAELAPYLRSGTNTFAVLVWYWGKHGFSHNSSGKAGLVFEAELDGVSLCSDTSWKALRHPAYGDTVEPHPNYRLPESNIRFDARLDIGAWMVQDFDDAAWTAATVFGQPPVAPWGGLVKRPIPLWKDSGLRDYENAAALPSVSTGGVVIATLPYNAHVTPCLKIDAPAGLVIDMRTDDYLPTGSPSVRAEYVTRAGVQEYETLGWMNGHEVRYTIPAGVKILGLTYRETGYNADFIGRFECDDAGLNRLWEKARRTLYVTMRDTYMDCPDRERAQWWGDAVNELGEAFYVFDAARGPLLAKKGMLELARWQRADGTLYSPIPAGRPALDGARKDNRDGTWNAELPPQMLASVGWYGFWTYYWYTGDRETIVEVYPAVKKYLSVWKLGEDGLAVHRAGDWDWADWGENADVAVLDSAWLYLALKGAIEMARLTGHEADVAEYRTRMSVIEKTFDPVFWKKECYRSSGHTGKTDDRANAMAVVSGLAKPERYAAIRSVLSREMHASPYMEKYVLEALYLMDGPEQAVERMKARYASMIGEAITTLWENFGGKNGRNGGGTYNHAWSGGPLTMLSQYAAGLAPTAPGWKRFSVKPQPGPLKRLDTRISTPHGDILILLRREDNGLRLELTAPPGTRATVELPQPEDGAWRRVSLNGQKVVQCRLIEVSEGRQIIVAEKDL
ncbi:MAG: alpha-L-rhamnosidase C-terminal domain-containing protein [bacterium]